jgi:hypothetical protein
MGELRYTSEIAALKNFALVKNNDNQYWLTVYKQERTMLCEAWKHVCMVGVSTVAGDVQLNLIAKYN